MKLTVALLVDGEDPKILYKGSSSRESEDFVQILSGLLDVPGDDSISVNTALTFSNQGCSVVVEQAGINILTLSCGANYPPSVNLKLKCGNYIYISLDVSEEGF